MKLLLLTPPLTQLNTPYPGTVYLAGTLQERATGILPHLTLAQADAGLDLVLRVFSKPFLEALRVRLGPLSSSKRGPAARHFLEAADAYLTAVEPAIRFLQGQDPTLANRIAARALLPEGPRMQRVLNEAEWESAFGILGIQDQAKTLASLFLDDLVDLVQETVDPDFGLSRYAEKLAASQLSFDPLAQRLERVARDQCTEVERLLLQIVEEYDALYEPECVGLSCPFPGNVYGAFLMAQHWKKIRVGKKPVRVILGGGYVNTELRELITSEAARDPRIFERIDAITYDDGERPLLALLEYWAQPVRPDPSLARLLRTLIVPDGKKTPVWVNSPSLHDIPQKDAACPSYAGLSLNRYLSLSESLNPMHRIWSDGRWNKLTLAHGCYWKKCNFCDVSLDYIGRFEASPAAQIVDRMARLIRETGQSGFHFVDEAAPPALLKLVAQEILRRGLVVSWWGNVRFEKTFTPELCALLARSGCIAMSGGLEVASPRLLKLMNKGVTVEQVAQVTHAMTRSGIMVHAYLMYGFPSQTAQETVDALERVRQLFAAGCIQSAFWHRFSVTAHSPVGRDPQRFGVQILTQGPTRFAWNDLEFKDSTGVNHDLLGPGLKRALYNFMNGVGLDQDVRSWFVEWPGGKRAFARPDVARDLVESSLAKMGGAI